MKIKYFIIVLVFVLVLIILINKGERTAEITPPVDDSSALASACVNAGGNYLAEFNECEMVSAEVCTILGGTFNECASACRNDPEAEFCTMQCVQVCDLE